MLNLQTPIRYLKGVGETRAEKLFRLGIDTVGALLRFYPRAYQDLSCIKPISECIPGEKVCIRARIITPVAEQFIRKNMTLYKFSISDDSGNMAITLFNSKYLAKSLHLGSEYLFFGKTSEATFLPAMSSPEIEEVGAMGIRPIYPSGAGLTSKAIERLVKTALSSTDLGDDPLPKAIRQKNRMCDLNTAISNIHFPKSIEALETAKTRLAFEELFILQTALMLLKGKKRSDTQNIIRTNAKDEFLSLLPYPVTSAQNRAIDECTRDMMSGKSMNRLIQGDVGSGKTTVAAALMYIAAKNNMQSALMAPTEVLAEQHFETLTKLFEKSDISCCLLTGSVTKAQKNKIKDKLKNGEHLIAVGTHALISDNVEFRNLGLVITDEQHRFGVAQRAKFAEKGINPHTLVMSATPIPRTLALIIYGDLDISVINEYPKGRQKIDSYVVTSALRTRIYNYIKKHLEEGRQGYIVCPLVEDTEDSSLTSAQEYFDTLSKSEFSKYSVGLLHGKMNSKDKESVMRRFKNGDIQLLICTTVIEVGVDVPNAAIMVIENAERFGLSQLHQLRGRIGRGAHKSSCIFISDITHGTTAERLSVIKSESDGFRIADEDLRLRGPGDFLGNRQHGLPALKIADISADLPLLRLAGSEASNLLISDPHLKKEENLALRESIKDLYRSLNEN